MIRMVVTGRHGQIATALRERGPRDGFEIICLGRPELDLGDAVSITRSVIEAAPDVIVSVAAYTAVDRAESEPELAFSVNEDGPRRLAEIAERLGVPLVHISTDYVFDGRKGAPYAEGDAVNPLGVYGRSKLAGEVAVRGATDNHVILRTSWVYSPFGRNFVRTMLRLAEEHDAVRVVADQFGRPSSAEDIANGVIAVAGRLLGSGDEALRGTFHMAGGGNCSWADFATAIFEEAGRCSGPSATVVPITTADYPTAAARPADSRLASDLLFSTYGIALPYWRDGVAEVVARLAAIENWAGHRPLSRRAMR